MKYSKDEQAFIEAVKRSKYDRAFKNLAAFLAANPVAKSMAQQTDHQTTRLAELLLGGEPAPLKRQPEPPPIPFDPQAANKLYGPKKD